MNNVNLIAMAQDLTNWMPMTEVSERYPQFGSKATLKHLFWKRDERPGQLESASRLSAMT